jgi:hypothetical protein
MIRIALRRQLFLLVSVLVLLAACGRAEEPAVDEVRAANRVAAGAFGEQGTGFIHVGHLRHELTVQRCIAMFGAVSGMAVSVTEPDNVSVSFEFSPVDWRERDPSEGWEEAGNISVGSEDPYNQWITGQSLVSDYNLGGMDSATFDITSLDAAGNGRSVRGEAVFVEYRAILSGVPEQVPGTFQFSCPRN